MKKQNYKKLFDNILYKSRSFFLNTNGQTLIEVSIALSIILITLASIAVVVTVSVSNSSFIKNQSQAAKYSQDGMEHIRYIRGSDPLLFSTYSGTRCMNTDNSFSDGICTNANIDAQFVREAKFVVSAVSECTNVGQTEVTITTKWKSSKCKGADIYCHKSVLTSCFQNLPATGL